jgi:hypothetical protein
MLAAWAAGRGDVSLHHHGSTCNPAPDRQGQQAFAELPASSASATLPRSGTGRLVSISWFW